MLWTCEMHFSGLILVLMLLGIHFYQRIDLFFRLFLLLNPTNEFFVPMFQFLCSNYQAICKGSFLSCMDLETCAPLWNSILMAGLLGTGFVQHLEDLYLMAIKDRSCEEIIPFMHWFSIFLGLSFIIWIYLARD